MSQKAFLEFISLTVTRNQEGGFELSLRYFYSKKPATPKQRIEFTKTLLRDALDRLERSKLADLGFSEDVKRRIRTDQMEV